MRDGTQRILAAEFSTSFANCYTFKLASLGNNNSENINVANDDLSIWYVMAEQEA